MEENYEGNTKTCAQCGAVVTKNARFCNACGYAFVNVCPHCGKEQDKNAKFCENCGCGLSNPTARVHAPKTHTVNVDITKIAQAVCNIAPAVLLALFAVLTFLFYLTPMVVAPLLGNMGNVYQFMRVGDLDIMGVRGLAVAYLTLSVLTLGIGVLCVLCITPIGKRLRVGHIAFSSIASWVSVVVYGIYMITSIVFLVNVGKVEETASSTASILLLIFSIVFLLLNVTCNVLRLTVYKTGSDGVKAKLGWFGKWFRYTPAGFLGMFAGLTFISFLAPVLHNELLGDIGSVYAFMKGDELLNEFRMRGFAVAYFVVAMVACIVAIAYVVAVTPIGRRVRFGKETFLYDVLSWIALSIYVTYVILSAVLAVQAKKEECSSSVATLSLVYALVFLILSSGCKALGYTRLGVRIHNPKAMEKPLPLPPKPAVLATLDEGGEVEKLTTKYLKDLRLLCKYAIWFLCGSFVVFSCIATIGYSREIIGWGILTAGIFIGIACLLSSIASFMINQATKTKTIYNLFIIKKWVRVLKIWIMHCVICITISAISLWVLEKLAIDGYINGNFIDIDFEALIGAMQPLFNFGVIFFLSGFFMAICTVPQRAIKVSLLCCVSVGIIFIITFFNGVHNWGQVLNEMADFSSRSPWFFEDVWWVCLVLLFVIIAVISILFLSRKNKKFFSNSAIQSLCDLCTKGNIIDMEIYLSQVKVYNQERRQYEWYCYDKEKYVQYTADAEEG